MLQKLLLINDKKWRWTLRTQLAALIKPRKPDKSSPEAPIEGWNSVAKESYCLDLTADDGKQNECQNLAQQT